VGLTTPHSKKLTVTKVEQRNKLDRFNDNRRKRTRYTEITLATWNIQNMLQPGKMKEIMEEIGKARVDVAAVQEIRWQGQGRIDAQLDCSKNVKIYSKIYMKDAPTCFGFSQPSSGSYYMCFGKVTDINNQLKYDVYDVF